MLFLSHIFIALYIRVDQKASFEMEMIFITLQPCFKLILPQTSQNSGSVLREKSRMHIQMV